MNRSICPLLTAILLALPTGWAAASEPAREALPTVVLLGDSIRLSYAPAVAKAFQGKAVVVSPAANGGDSSNVLKHLDAWVIRERPALVHFNCGIHDTKKYKSSGRFQTPPEKYESNLKKIVERIRKETGAVVLFATTTPILDDRAARVRSDRDYELLGGSVEQYNGIAKKLMKRLEVPVDDLHAVLSAAQPPATAADLIGSDGVHLLPEGQEMLGKTVAEFIGKHLRRKP